MAFDKNTDKTVIAHIKNEKTNARSLSCYYGFGGGVLSFIIARFKLDQIRSVEKAAVPLCQQNTDFLLRNQLSGFLEQRLIFRALSNALFIRRCFVYYTI